MTKLEDEANKFAKGYAWQTTDDFYIDGAIDAFIAGANYREKNPSEGLYSKSVIDKIVTDFLKWLPQDHGHKYNTEKEAWDDFKKIIV